MKLLQHVTLTHTKVRTLCILLPGFPATPAVTSAATPTGAVYRRNRRGTLHVQSCTDTEYEIANAEHGALESSCVPLAGSRQSSGGSFTQLAQLSKFRSLCSCRFKVINCKHVKNQRETCI